MERCKSIAALLKRLESEPENPKALGQQITDGWKTFSTHEMLQLTRRVALGLASLGHKKGDMIGIIAPSSAYWTIADFAIAGTGGIVIPMFPNMAEDNFLFEVEQTKIKTVFVSGEAAWKLIKKYAHLFTTIINIEIEKNDEALADAMPLSELASLGDAVHHADPELYSSLLSQVKPSDLATIIYTSGSTGVPKGAMITHEALTATIDKPTFEWFPESDLYLTVLPLAHVFGRDINVITIGNRISTYYVNDVKTFGNSCRELHPTILVVVPRLLEKVYAKMLANVHQAGLLKRTIGQWAFDLAADEHEYFLKHMFHTVADKVVYSALRTALGGRVRAVVSGGAKTSPFLLHFFNEIGIPIYEGWGLTESCPVTLSRIDANKVGAVGKPLQNMELKIDENGEVLVKGDVVMQGYYQNPELNGKIFTSDGWLRTGDKGSIDEEGYLTILGRIKELFKTSTGEYVAPVPIEQAIAKAPLIDTALVVADGRKYATALLFPDFDVLVSLKQTHKKADMSDEEFLNSEFVRSEMASLFEQVNTHLNRWEKILDYRFVPYHLTPERGDLTPSMKVRREIVEKRFADIIESMYIPDEAAYSMKQETSP